jgi:peptidoglycan/LPS O-acetylase OafA/YrhL
MEEMLFYSDTLVAMKSTTEAQKFDLTFHALTDFESRMMDSVRGFLCVYVLTYHWYAQFIKSNRTEVAWYDRFFIHHGNESVLVFFILSGFLISHSYARLRLEVDGSVWRVFYGRRFFRLAPVWIATFMLYTWQTGEERLWVLLYNFFLLFGFTPYRIEALTVPQSWSLFTEGVFYLAFGLFIVLCQRRWILWGVLAFSLLSAYLHAAFEIPEGFFFATPFNTFQYFFSGVAIYLFWPNLRQMKISLMPFLVFVMVLLYAVLYLPSKMALIPAFTIFLFLLLLRPIPLFSKLFECLFRRIGRMCYSFYLLHLFCMMTSYQCLRGVMGVKGSELALWTLVATLIVTTLASELIYLLIERPGINLGKKLIR